MSGYDGPASPGERETLAQLLRLAGQLAQAAGMPRDEVLSVFAEIIKDTQTHILVPEGLSPAQPAKVLSLAGKEQAPCSA